MSQRRVHLQLVLRGRPRHRAVLERPPAAARPGRRPGPADARHRRVRVARLPAGRRHAQAINPPSGVILNWNNKPARGLRRRRHELVATAPCSGSTCSTPQRSRRGRSTRSPASSRRMNKAATQDLRVVRSLAAARAACSRPARARPRAAQLPTLLDALARRAAQAGSTANLDGKIDDPGAAIMDAAWPQLADAVLAPVLGPLIDRLAAARCRATTQPARAAPRTARAGTATSTRICAGCSAAGRRAVPHALLRRRRPRRLPRLAVGGTRRRRAMRSRPRRAPTRRVAGRRDAGADHASPGRPAATRCAGRTARRSSR